MDWTSTPRMLRKFLLCAGIITSTLFYAASYAQTKHYAQVAPSSGTVAYYTNLLGINSTQVNAANAGSVANPGNAAAAPPPALSPAVLTANYATILGLFNAEGEAWIELKYAAPVAAGKTTYVRFDTPTPSSGLSLDLLNTVGGLTGLFSKNLVELEAYTGASSTNDGTKIETGVSSIIVKDAAGLTYFAVTSASAYNAVRVKLRVRSSLLQLSLNSGLSMNVYTAFNIDTDNCGTAVFTNLGETPGLNVSLTPLVSNQERAIDGNLTTYSLLTPGVAGLGSSVSQTVFLNGLSSSSDVAKVVLSEAGTVLSLNLLKTITLQAFNGNVAAGAPVSADNLLTLDLLVGNNNVTFPVFFTPGVAFDRIKITLDNTLAVGGNLLSGGLRINEVQRTVAKPIFGGALNGALSICGGSSLTLAAQNPNAGFTYNFYKKTAGARVLVSGAGAGTYTEAGLIPGNYTYYIGAQKAGCTGESDLDSVVVTVKPVLSLVANTLTNATVGSTVTRQLTAATGGTPGYTYALAAGSSLPAGLTMSASGLITGTPTASGTFNFNVTATDTFGCKTTASYTLLVTATLTFPATTLPNGTVGIAYPSTTLNPPTGGSTPYIYTAANVPAGLSVNSSTGTINGTPTTSGTFTFPITVTDADGNTAMTNFTVIIRDPMAMPVATLSAGTTGMVYPTQIIPAATGGSGVNTYTASSLPPGLSFNPSTREITGTPTASGTFNFTINAADNEGHSATGNYTIVIKDPLVLPAGTLPDGTVMMTYSGQTIPVASGGTGPYTYAATNLPPGITFNTTTRVISGTPTQSGNFTILITVTDAAQQSLTVPYSLKVNGTLNLPIASLPATVVGTAYTSPALPAVSGGTAPYLYTLTGLPAGLSFNPTTRVISGTSQLGGTFTLKMSVTDNGGLSTSTDYTLNITVDPPSVAGTTICGGNSATLTVANPLTGVTYNFYSATGNTVLGSGTTYTTGTLTETTTYYAEAVSGTAASARVAVTVTVNPAPAAPVVATTNETVSSGQTATLQASAAGGATVKWYDTPTGGIARATGNTFTTPALNATTTYYAGAESSLGCASLTRVPVVVTVTTGPADPRCNAATSQQSGVGGLLCIGCGIQNPSNSTDANLNNFTTISLLAGVGASGYQRLIFANTGAATDSIRVDLETPTGLADLSVLGNITLNVMNGTTLVSSHPINSSLVTLGLLQGNRFLATVLAGGAYDRVEVLLNPVVTALTNLNIYGAQAVYANPTLTAGNQTICSGSTATLTAIPAAGTTLSWYASASSTTALATNVNTYTTAALSATATYYIEVRKNGCPNSTRIPVIVTVTPAVITPVLAAVSPVCSGSTAVISVDSPQAGVTYNWYSTATGGVPVFTGPVFTTPVLTANATYYVEGANGNCVSPARTTASVIVNPRPAAPQIQASATTVNQGQSVSLTASSAETNVTFNWYDSANATTPVFTGVTYVTPPLSVTTTFYVEAVSSTTGCASSARVQQTIIVNGNGTPIPVLCESPVSQTNGVEGLVSVLARVVNPGLAIDADQQTASTLSVPVGVGSSVFQKVNFTGLSSVGDTLRIRLTTTGQLLSASVLPSITITTFNGANSNNDLVVLNNSIANVQLLSGGAELLLNLVPGAQFDGAEVRLNSGLLGALSSVNFNYARRIIKAPIVAAAVITACANATASLTVSNPQSGITYKWYDAAGNYLGNDGSSFVTPVITANTRFFAEASRGGCGGSRTAVEVTLVPAADVPVLLSATEQTCQGANLLLQVQNPQAGVTYQWYNANGPITGATGPTYSVTNIQATATYSVAAVNSCGTASAQASVTITVGSLTAPVVTPPAVSIFAGERTILTASSSTANLIYNWYAVNPAANPGAVAIYSSADGAFATPALTATTTYYVTAQSTAIGGCISPATAVTVTVTAGPTNPGSVPCEPAISQTTNTNNILASVNNPTFAIDNDIETSSSLFIPLGINSFVSQRVGFNGVSQAGDKVRIRLTSEAGLLSLALAPSIMITTYNGVVSNNDGMAINNPLLNLQLLNGGSDAIIEFTPTSPFDGVEVRLNSGLLGALSSINFNYAQRIAASPVVVATSVTACQGSSATLAVGNPVTGTTYNWYRETDLVASTSTYLTPLNLAAGTYNYFVSATRNNCESARTAVTVTITPLPATPVPDPANPVNTCLGTPVVLRVTPVTGISYNWYSAPAGGTLLAANTNTFSTPANLAVGTTDFYVEAVNSNSCTNNTGRTKISITIKPAATANDIAVTGADATFCSGANVILTASSMTVTNPVFTWYNDAALANPVFTGATFTLNPLTSDADYYVTVKGDNACDNAPGTAKKVSLRINPTALPGDITISGIPASVCAGSAVTLTATSATVNNPVFTWYSDAALSTAVFTGAVFSPVITASTNYYVTVSGSNKCQNAAADAKVITLNVNPIATDADINIAGVPATTCSGSGVSITASSTTVINPVFTWYSDAALANALFTGPVFNTPALTGNTTYYVTVRGSNKCENAAGTAKIVVLNVNPAVVFNSSTLTNAAAGSAYTTQIDPATGGTPGYNYVVASGSSLPAGLTLSISGAITGTPTIAGNYTFAITAADSKGCNATATFVLNVLPPNFGMVLPPADLPDGIVGTTYITQTLPAATGGVSPYTYIVSGGTLPPGLLFNVTNREISGIPTLGGTFTFNITATDNNGLTATTAYSIKVTVPAPVVAGAESCSGNSVDLAVTTPVNGVTYNWYSTPSGGAIIFSGTIYQTPPVTSTVTYYVEGASGTAVSTRVAVLVTLRSKATAADITIAGIPTTVCSGSGTTLTASSATVTNPVFTWYSDAALTTVANNGAVFNVPVLTVNGVYYVTVSGDNKCENAAGSASIVVLNVNPAIVFNGTALSDAPATKPYAVQINPATGGTPGYTYTLPSGSILPDGLTLSANGVISGTPTIPGTNTFTITVLDSKGCSATASFTLTIVPPPVIVPAPDVNAAQACLGSRAILSVNAPVAGTIYRWYSSATGGVALDEGTTFTTPPVTTNITYYAEAVIGTAVSSRTAVGVTIKPTAVAGDITITGLPSTLCSGSGTTLTASSNTVSNPVFTWYSDAQLTQVANNGAVFNVVPLTGTTTYYVTVSGSDKCENTPGTANTVVINVNAPLVFNTTVLNNAPAGTAYNVQLNPATGGTPGYTYTLTAGSTLPAGLSISSAGTITGTPTAVGNYTFSITAIDSKGCTTSNSFSLNIVAVTPAPDVAAGLVCLGTSATLNIISPVSGTTYRWYNVATGGTFLTEGTTFLTPPVTANTTYYVEAVTASGVSSRTAVSVTIKPTATAGDITITGLPSTLCSGSGTTLTASTNSVANPVFIWYSNAALTQVANNGATFNVPPLTGTTTYYVTVSGSDKCENTAGTANVVVVNVNPPLVFTGTALTNASSAANYSAQLNPATGGTPGYTYGVTAGSQLPAGMALSATGILSGRPATPGNYSFQVTAIDSKGCTATATFTLTVNAGIPMSLPPATLPDGIVGSIYAPQTLPAAVGGTGPFTYVATGLPPGIVFNTTTRELTGTPTLAGPFTVTVSVTDANGQTAAADYTLNVTVPAPGATGAQSCNGSSVTLTVAAPVTGVTYNWFATATSTASLQMGTSYQTPAITTTTTYYVEGTSGDIKSTRTAVTVTLASALTAPMLSVASATRSSITFSWNAVSGATSYEISIDGGTTWTVPSSGQTGTTHTITGLQYNTKVTLMVRAKGNTTCETSASGSLTGTATDGTTDEIYIPNTFTPNGDGRNDVFYAYGNAISKVKMRIYNQWGQFVFESQQMQNGWDGSFRGQMQPNGVYVYYIDLTLSDGTTTMRKGTITLLR